MKKIQKTILFMALFLLSVAVVFAQESHDAELEEGKKLVESGVSCSQLTDEQLEAIGDYYMEQMHPGQAHEMMDTMMGGEGSTSLEQVHINMARRLYCDENLYIGYGMMDSGGMMNMMGGLNNMMGQGMMGGGYGFGYWNFINILFLLLLIGLIVLVYLWILKLWKSTNAKGRK